MSCIEYSNWGAWQRQGREASDHQERAGDLADELAPLLHIAREVVEAAVRYVIDTDARDQTSAGYARAMTAAADAAYNTSGRKSGYADALDAMRDIIELEADRYCERAPQMVLGHVLEAFDDYLGDCPLTTHDDDLGDAYASIVADWRRETAKQVLGNVCDAARHLRALHKRQVAAAAATADLLRAGSKL